MTFLYFCVAYLMFNAGMNVVGYCAAFLGTASLISDIVGIAVEVTVRRNDK